MTKKIENFDKKLIAEKIHSYLINLHSTEYDDNAKGPSIGYKRKHQKYKFATLHGGKSYQSLVLHINPGNRKTTIGKDKQKEIQKMLDYDISVIRSHKLKTNEVYIPLEKLHSSNPIDRIKYLIDYAYNKQDEFFGKNI